MGDLGIIVSAEGGDGHPASDVRRVRVAQACDRAELPLDGIGKTIAEGRLSFAFLEASPVTRGRPTGRSVTAAPDQST
jgi:hypothetical protein